MRASLVGSRSALHLRSTRRRTTGRSQQFSRLFLEAWLYAFFTKIALTSTYCCTGVELVANSSGGDVSKCLPFLLPTSHLTRWTMASFFSSASVRFGPLSPKASLVSHASVRSGLIWSGPVRSSPVQTSWKGVSRAPATDRRPPPGPLSLVARAAIKASRPIVGVRQICVQW